jgi:glutaconate CoA-transferase subunit B
MSQKQYTREELMVAVCSHFIADYDKVFVGIGIPQLAAMVATRTHAPNALLIFEGGAMGPSTRRIMLSVGDNSTSDNALMAGELWRALGDVQRGRVNIGVVGGAQIDKFGNINSTVILGSSSDYRNPKVRLGGSGGANDIASSVNRVFIIMRLEKRRFVEKVDHLTSPGFLGGGTNERKPD